MPRATLGEAFSGTEALGPAVRSTLAGLLGCSPDRIETSALGDLTDRRHRRRLVLAIQSAVEAKEVLRLLGGATLGSLAPGAALLPDAVIDPATWPNRLAQPLGDHGVRRWSWLLALRLDEIAEWSGVEVRGAALLLGLAVDRSLLGLLASRGGGRIDDLAGDLALLVEHDDRVGQGALRAALAGLAGTKHPEPVRRAAGRLLRSDQGRSRPLEDALDDMLIAAGSARDRAVFVARELNPSERPTQKQLAQRFRLSPERIRQVGVRAAMRVRAAASEAPAPAQRLVTGLGDRLGTAVPVEHVEPTLVEIGGGVLSPVHRHLLLWLAGPYQVVRGCDGWLAVEPDRLVARTSEALTEDGGTRLADTLRDELATAGVVAAHRDGWLQACGAVLVDDMVASTTGTIADVIERVLFAAGRPMSGSQLCVLVAGADELALRRAVKRDRRFALADGADEVELFEWRGAASPATTPRHSGACPDAVQPSTARPSSSDGCVWLRVLVDAELLAGGCYAVPPGPAEAIDLSTNQRRTFAGRFGPVSLVHTGEQLLIESLRPVALASGAGPGDTIVLGFGPDGSLDAKLSIADEPAAAYQQRAEGA